MAKPNRICHFCGKPYYYCPGCPDDKRDPGIYIMWDDEKCKQAFCILTEEFLGRMNTSEAKRQLLALGWTQNSEVAKHEKEHFVRVIHYSEITQECVENRFAEEKLVDRL